MQLNKRMRLVSLRSVADGAHTMMADHDEVARFLKRTSFCEEKAKYTGPHY